METIELRLPSEIERDKRNADLIERYLKLKEADKNNRFKPNRFIIILEKEFNLSNVAIRNILKNNRII